MRDYDNMPELDWSDEKAAQKAAAQIIHQEPVILRMPESFDASVDPDAFGCELQGSSGILYNCNGGKVLRQLALQNHLPDLDIVAAACIRSSSQVDIDSAHQRLIVHD